MRRLIGNQQGVTLMEIMFAVAIIGVGLAALAAAIPIAAYGIQEGNQLSTATFLVNQRLEQVRNARWEAGSLSCGAIDPTVGVDKLGLSASSTAAPISTCAIGDVGVTFSDEGALDSPYTGYARTVRVTSCGVGAGCNGIVDADLRQATVAVRYRPMTGIGVAAAGTTKATTITIYIAKR